MNCEKRKAKEAFGATAALLCVIFLSRNGEETDGLFSPPPSAPARTQDIASAFTPAGF